MANSVIDFQSPWTGFFQDIESELQNALDPFKGAAIRQEVDGMISAALQMAAQAGGDIGSDFQTRLMKDYQAFIQDPNASTLAQVNKDIEKLMSDKLPQQNDYTKTMALQPLQNLIALLATDPQGNQNEIQGMIETLIDFCKAMPNLPSLLVNAQQIQSDFKYYLQSPGDPNALTNVEADILRFHAALESAP